MVITNPFQMPSRSPAQMPHRKPKPPCPIKQFPQSSVQSAPIYHFQKKTPIDLIYSQLNAGYPSIWPIPLLQPSNTNLMTSPLLFLSIDINFHLLFWPLFNNYFIVELCGVRGMTCGVCVCACAFECTRLECQQVRCNCHCWCHHKQNLILEKKFRCLDKLNNTQINDGFGWRLLCNCVQPVDGRDFS